MTRFVERAAGAVVGVYRNRQPGFAEEALADNDPEIIAFLGPKPDSARIAGLKLDAGLIDLLNRLDTATVGQIDAWLAANVTTLAQARTVLAAMIKVMALNRGGT